MIQSPFISNAPPSLTGKDFEALIMFRARQMTEAGLWHFGRYGVKCVRMHDKLTGQLVLQEMQSLPDFEGSISPSGRQVVAEAKVCSQASYKWEASTKTKQHQIEHLLARSKMGALCWLIVHFNERQLQRKHEEPFTVAIPIYPDSQIVRDVLASGTKTLTRDEATLYGRPVPWTTFGSRGIKQTPDLSVLMTEWRAV